MVKHIGDKSELLTKDEMTRILNAVQGNVYFSSFYKTLCYSGRRFGEIYGTKRDGVLFGGIKLSDIDFDNKVMKTVILKKKKRKLSLTCTNCHEDTTYKNKFCPRCGTAMPEFDVKNLIYYAPTVKEIPMRPELVDILRLYIVKMHPKEYLFREYSISYLKKAIKRHMAAARITKRFSLHGFRHYFITRMKMAGLTDDELILWTGHSNTQTLRIYDHRAPKDVEDKILKVDL